MPSFNLSPASQSVVAGANATITVHWALGGVTGDFTLSDGGSGGTFTPASLVGTSDGVTFTYSNATAGTYTITVTGVGGSLAGVAETCTVTVTALARRCVTTAYISS
jgi:hypothetical protein